MAYRNPAAARKLNKRHVSTLQRRHDFLAACEATDTANSYEKAERAALAAALPELLDVLEAQRADVDGAAQFDVQAAPTRRA